MKRLKEGQWKGQSNGSGLTLTQVVPSADSA